MRFPEKLPILGLSSENDFYPTSKTRGPPTSLFPLKNHKAVKHRNTQYQLCQRHASWEGLLHSSWMSGDPRGKGVVGPGNRTEKSVSFPRSCWLRWFLERGMGGCRDFKVAVERTEGRPTGIRADALQVQRLLGAIEPLAHAKLKDRGIRQVGQA